MKAGPAEEEEEEVVGWCSRCCRSDVCVLMRHAQLRCSPAAKPPVKSKNSN